MAYFSVCLQFMCKCLYLQTTQYIPFFGYIDWQVNCKMLLFDIESLLSHTFTIGSIYYQIMCITSTWVII